MASNSLLSEEQLLCPICLDVFTRPVTTPCGHSFCMSCISEFWCDPAVHQCPLCKKTFERRPDLNVNTVLSELSSQLKFLTVSNADVQEVASCGGAVLCDVCSEKQQPAVKSCLECATSYCAAHLEPHHRAAGLKRHTLLRPTSSLQDQVCKEHTRLLSRFCTEEGTLLCDVCVSSNHSGHDVVSVQQVYEEAKDEMQQMMKKRLERVKKMKELVENSKTETKDVIAESMQELSGLVSEIQQNQAQLLQVMEEKQKAAEEKAAGFLISVKEKMNELEQTQVKITELIEAEDPVSFLLYALNTSVLQHRTDSLHFHSSELVEIHRLLKCWSRFVPKLQKLLKEMSADVGEILSGTKEPDDMYLRFLRQYVVNVSLDPGTAHPQLIVSDDRKQVRYNDRFLENVNRFASDLSVLGDKAFSIYKFYFEVSVGRKTEWCLGMAEESIRRCGVIPRRPGCGLWAIWFKEGRFETFCNPNVLVHHGRVEQVGVYVHYAEKSIEFYDVKTLTKIYEFRTCSFKDKLYPYLSPCGSKCASNLEPMVLIPVLRTEWS